MFFFLPIGHDKTVAGAPWATTGLIVACAVVFAMQSSAGDVADARIDMAMARVTDVLDEYPDACVTPRLLDPLPAQLRQNMAGLMSTDAGAHDGDTELYYAALGLVQAVQGHPTFKYGYRPDHPRVYALLTHMFMHGDIFHLIGNMLFLFLAGSVVESAWGRGRFLGCYFLTGLVAVGAHHLAAHGSGSPLVGASGAIAGLMGAFLIADPAVEVNFFYFYAFWGVGVGTGTRMVPAWIVLPLWMLEQVWYVLRYGSAGGGVAYMAHIGGFAAGVALGMLARRAGVGVAMEGRQRIGGGRFA